MEYIWLVPAFPLLGVVINGLFGRSHLRERAHFVAVPAAGLSFLIALLISLQVFAGQTLDLNLYPWVVAGDFQVPMGFLVDPLSTVMMLTVTFVGSARTAIFNEQAGLSALIVLGITAILVYASVTGIHVAGKAPPPVETAPALGRLLLTTHVLPFEVASVLLLAAMVGAIILARREQD